MRLVIDTLGDVTGDVAGLNKTNIEVAKNESQTIALGLTNTIEVSGDFAKHIEETYFLDCKTDQDIKGVLYTQKCGGQAIPVVITKEGSFSNPYTCKAKIILKEDTDETPCYEYLDTTLITENGFSEAYNHPRVYYCNQPNYLTGIVFAFRFVLIPVVWILCNLINIVNTLINKTTGFLDFIGDVVDAVIPGDVIPELSTDLPSFDCDGIREDIDNFITGCGKYTVTFLVRDVFEYHTGQCGLSFKSSIFQNPASPRYNTVYWQQKEGKGASYDKEVVTTEEPVLTPIGLAELLKTLIPNTEYCIVDGVLIFEHISYFRQNSVELFSMEEEAQNISINSYFNFKPGSQFANGLYAYADDFVDRQGAKLTNPGRPYYDRVEFNSPPRESQKGTKNTRPQIGGARFMFDVISNESATDGGVLSLTHRIDIWRKGGNFGGVLQALGLSISGPLGALLLKNGGIKRQHDLILENDSASFPKILALELNFDWRDAKVIKAELGKHEDHTYYHYNYPYYYKQDLPELISKNELINEFAQEDNPRVYNRGMSVDGKIVTPFEFCDRVEKILQNKIGVYVATRYGRAFPNVKLINYENCTIELSDFEVDCNN